MIKMMGEDRKTMAEERLETTAEISERIFRRAKEMAAQGEYSTEAGEIIRLYREVADVAMRLAALEVSIKDDLIRALSKAMGKPIPVELLPPEKH